MENRKPKKVVTVGVFDFFHLGHLNVVDAASKCGDHLIVAVHDDKLNIKGVEFLYDLEERMRFIKSLRQVEEVVPYERVDLLLKDLDFDVFAHGPDQKHEYFQKAFQWCRENGKEMVELERTEGISSTKLRTILKNRDI